MLSLRVVDLFLIFLIFNQCCLKTVAEGNVPRNTASLAFVFDTTSSMSDELAQAIEGATKILNTTLSSRENPVSNYVLVPFNDPGE